jgi:aldehyde:ferredoxin oxidoreductase
MADRYFLISFMIRPSDHRMPFNFRLHEQEGHDGQDSYESTWAHQADRPSQLKHWGLCGLGGRAMTSAIVAKEVPPTLPPLGCRQQTGHRTGTAQRFRRRHVRPAVSVGCKSPLTGGIKEANSGGQAAQVMGRLGYAAIILEGESRRPLQSFYQQRRRQGGIRRRSQRLGNYAAVEKLAPSSVRTKVACITIGQAGEMKMAAASIAFTDMEQRPTRHAGRGGVGAVMGSKGVKAIIAG